MSMNPWLTEQMAAEHIKDLECAADGRRRALARDPESSAWHRPARGALARQVGVLLISVGRRLAEPDAFPAAFDAPHRH